MSPDIRKQQIPHSCDAADHTGLHSYERQQGERQKGGGDMRAAVLIAVMAAVTMMLRFLPFIVFRRHVPAYISYLGEVLPPAIIGMLVIYCLKDVEFASGTHGIPELIAAACVVILQIWKRQPIISILCGTAVYMLLVQLVF